MTMPKDYHFFLRIIILAYGFCRHHSKGCRLTTKHIGGVFQIGVYLLLNVGILRIELVVLSRLCIC